ncbi:MAG: MFS transporter [Candidatus Omnitrophica bacterium]|nr:MFS transporter [Candidatus Omnitrophota bacterium]
MPNPDRQKAFQIIILFGLVSLFGDILYEGARSVNGPYLKIIGANAIMVGLIAGIGEFLGYAIRLFSGYFADKTKAYWIFVAVGYGMLISVPLLALTGIWQIASIFIVAERLGKALRSPARDTILSQATKQVGTGFGFAIAEVMDQIGALTGPLIFTGLFMFLGKGTRTIADYQLGYSFLWIPFVCIMLCVYIAYRRVPHPELLEQNLVTQIPTDNLNKIFWQYNIFTFLTTLGFVNFVLLGYYFKANHLLTDTQIPLFYAVAMAVDAVAALAIGKIYDVLKHKTQNPLAGLNALVVIPILTAIMPVFIFSKNFGMILTGIALWGTVMGCHETIMRSAIADLTPLKKRGTGYGIFNTSYGLAMLVGGILFGLLFEKLNSGILISVIIIEAASLIPFWQIKSLVKNK